MATDEALPTSVAKIPCGHCFPPHPQLRDEVVGLGPLGWPSRWANPVNIEKAIENDDFSIENDDFPIENCDFPIKNGDVPIKSCDFPIKNGHRKLVDLPSYKMVIYKRVCRVDVTWWTLKKVFFFFFFFFFCVIQPIQFSHMLFESFWCHEHHEPGHYSNL